MPVFRDILEWIADNYTVMALLLTLTAGLYAFFADYGQMRAKKLEREALWARRIGLAYTCGGIGLWLTIQIMLRLLGMR
jgi:hypothetical protein